MTDTSLIARLEAATEAEQASLIGQAIELAYRNGWIGQDARLRAINQIQYGAFIDAALTLLPKTACNHELFSFIGSEREDFGGIAWAFRFSDRAQLMGDRAAHEEIARLKRTSPTFGKLAGEPLIVLEKAIAEHFIEFHCWIAATPALALCIAALKARQGDDHG